MSKITLKPLDDGQKAVVIPLGKTTIGRGPFLGCSDKKVSRNHAVLEVTSKGEVYLTPTHVNPCFFLQPGVGEGDPGIILKKDVPHKLEDGETFSLLPRAYRYQLSIIQDRNEVNKGETNGSAGDVLEHVHKEADEQPPVEEPPEDKKEDKTPSPPKEEPPAKENHTKEESTGDEEGRESNNHTKEKEEPKVMEEVETKEDKESCEESRDEGTLDTLPSKVSEEEEEEESAKPVAKRGRKKQETKSITIKRKAGGTRGGGRKKLSDRFDFEEGTSQRVSGGRTSSRTNRQTRQGLSLEDFVVSDDEEWQSFEDASPRRRRKKRGPGRKRGDESGSDWEIEHKRPKKTPKAGEGSEESGSDWGTPKKKGGPKGKRRKGKAQDESEEAGSEADQGPAPTTAKPRTNCTYGKKCYRRNQSHVAEFSHPGDSDYEETDPKEEEETVKKECPYGANCFRKNAQHKRDFKHTKKVRPQREAAKLADKKAKGSKNSDEVDSYDLNDSLLNDDSADEYKPADSGSDYESGTKKVTKAKAATKGAKRGRKA